MTTTFYNYMLLDPFIAGRWIDTDVCWLYEPFYVGKGTGTRYKWCGQQSSLSSHQHKNFRIKSILKQGQKPITVVFREGKTEEQALLDETSTICTLGTRAIIENVPRGPLTNHKTEGAVSKYSVEAREKMSVAAKKRVRQPHSEETKEKMRQARLNMSDEKKQELAKKASLLHKGKTLSADQCNRLSKLHRGKTISAEHKAALIAGSISRERTAAERQAIKDRQNKQWMILCEATNEISTVTNMKEWCGSHNINYHTLIGTLVRQKFHKGYMVVGASGGNH